jgi:hypothetical protein
MSMLRTSLVLVATLGLGACAFDQGGAVDDRQLQEQLAGRAFLGLADTSTVGVTALDGDGNPMPYVEPSVHGGRAVLRTTDDGWLVVEDLEIHLDDVVIPQTGAKPMVLTNVELRLGTQLWLEPEWTGDGSAARGTAKADLLLDWGLVLDDGDVWPLATQKLGNQTFVVGVEQLADGSVIAQVDTTARGTVDQVNGLFTLQDLDVSVDAVEPAVE